MPTLADPVRSPGLLACEGSDDSAFLRSMLSLLGIGPEIVWIEEFGGLPQLRDYLDGLAVRPGSESLRALALVRDADASLRSALDSIREHLWRTDYQIRVRAGQLVPASWPVGTRLTLGVYILPDNRSSGALEDLYLQAISEAMDLSCVDEFLACVRSRTGVSCRPQDVPKARLNAWLASRRNPTRRPGQALMTPDIPFNSPAFGPIKQFLQELAVAATMSAQDDDDA